MHTSTSIEKIAPALLKAQAAIGAAKKGATNPHFKSKYADLGSVIEAVKEALNENGIAVLQPATGNTTGVVVETRLQHESGEWIAESLYLPVPQQTAQAFGSAITYGRRYSLQSLMLLPAEDDDGNKASETPARKDHGARQEAIDTLDKMSPEEQRFIRQQAEIVLTMFEGEVPDARSAAEHLGKQRLDTDQKTALWSLLPSNVRSALKRVNGPTPGEYGSQG